MMLDTTAIPKSINKNFINKFNTNSSQIKIRFANQNSQIVRAKKEYS